MTETTSQTDPKHRWTKRLRDVLPEFFEQHPVLSRFHRRASVIFHGSTTMGIDDEFSDLDLWLLLRAADLAELDAASEARFFEVTVDGKPGHLNADSVEGVSERLCRCDMDLIYQLRNAEIMSDNTGDAEQLICLACKPMPRRVSEAFFFYHYVEMRGEHRPCDNAIERGDATALLLAMAKTMRHAMQATMVLHHLPYPYDKWLHQAAMATPTGRQVGSMVDRICDLLADDALRLRMPQNEHPINVELMAIRHALIESAEENGIRDEWLRRWWLYMNQAQDAIKGIRWDADIEGKHSKQ